MANTRNSFISQIHFNEESTNEYSKNKTEKVKFE